MAVYVACFERYRGNVVNLDDFVRATVAANLATSSGHMGEAAISRSTRRDRSRDPLYNQLKMYAELFRSLGWLRSTEHSALNYTFTLLGEQVVAAGRHWRHLLGETVLGIAYPSRVLDIRTEHHIRPFAAILRTMLACNDGLSRDEMIVGPLSLTSDRSHAEMDMVSERIMSLREEPAAIKVALERLHDERGVQVNTMQNYTRWPLAIMRDLRWTEKDREAYRRGNRSFVIYRLTPLGKELAQRLVHSVDLRVDQVDQLPFDQKRALSRNAHFLMMKRSGFDLSSVRDQLRQEEDTLRAALHGLGVTQDRPILFSPFQSLSIADTTALFPPATEASARRSDEVVVERTHVGRGPRDHLFVAPIFVESCAEVEGADLDVLKAELRGLRETFRTLDAAAEAFVEGRSTNTQIQFYPLVTHLLQLLGFRSDYSRSGVNYQRWDACVWLHDLAVPIEIKSPAEELFLSTKAVRQAIENKVILLSRSGYDTERSLTSLIVGYQIPNERGDMSTLIDDVHSAFGFNIGVLDLRTMVLLAMRAVIDSVSIDEGQLSHLKGFLDV